MLKYILCTLIGVSANILELDLELLPNPNFVHPHEAKA